MVCGVLLIGRTSTYKDEFKTFLASHPNWFYRPMRYMANILQNLGLQGINMAERIKTYIVVVLVVVVLCFFVAGVVMLLII